MQNYSWRFQLLDAGQFGIKEMVQFFENMQARYQEHISQHNDQG